MSSVQVGPAAAVAVVCFLVGSVNPASLLARTLGKDLRSSGSGNPGATNAGRVLGVRWGVVVGLLDVVKAFLPAVLVLAWLGLPLALVAGLAVVLGHMFSPFLGGHGGKGVAAALGAMLAVAPWVALGAVVVFAVVVGVVRTVGRASVLTCLVLAAVGILVGLGAPGAEALAGAGTGWWVLVLSLLVISRHHRNIRAWLAARVG